MKRSLGTIAAAIACVGMVLPPTAVSAAPIAESNDIALRKGGVLVGQVVDQQGIAKAKTSVSVRLAEHEVAQTTTDDNGVFAVQGLRGGEYYIVTDDGASVCRLWAPETAPPAAKPAALVVAGNNVVRGVGPVDSWVAWCKAHPYITAGTIAAAIAVPLAFLDDDWDSGS